MVKVENKQEAIKDAVTRRVKKIADGMEPNKAWKEFFDELREILKEASWFII